MHRRALGPWSVLRARLVAYGQTNFPVPPAPGEISEVLFGEAGLEFLKESYPTQLTMMDAHLQRIDEDGYEASINELAGPEFLAALRAVAQQYRAMVADVLSREQPSGMDLLPSGPAGEHLTSPFH